MKQRWIRLFQHSYRDVLEENLNKFLSEYPDSEIKVWTDCGWYAQVIYSHKDQPTYFKPENEELFPSSD